jgi:hypothetical protein
MFNYARSIVASAAAVAFLSIASARVAHAAFVGDVFVIDMENNDWTTPNGEASFNAINGDTSAAPYINSLISTNPSVNPAYGQVSYANNYHNAYDTNATTPATDPNIHPSEPNYIWQESGSNLSINNDNDPYGSGGSVAAIASYLATNPTNLNGTAAVGQNLSGLMQAKGLSWKSYQEDTGLLNSNGQPFNQYGGTLTNSVAGAGQQTVPLASFSGSSSSYVNAYNGSHQYNFACKHDGTLFFNDTNGGDNVGPTNVEASHYEALQSLQSDLNNNTVGQYNLITPDQYNDMHTALSGGFTYNGQHFTGDQAQIAQGDNFLSKVIPQIMASKAYQNNGAIVLWLDETEGTYNDSADTLMEIVISPLAKGSTTGTGVYEDNLNFDHSSDVATFQEIFQTPAATASGYLNNASSALPGGAQDLSDLFVAGTIPTAVPEPTTFGLVGIAAAAMLGRRRSQVA